jgi:hypothetical protein
MVGRASDSSTVRALAQALRQVIRRRSGLDASPSNRIFGQHALARGDGGCTFSPHSRRLLIVGVRACCVSTSRPRRGATRSEGGERVIHAARRLVLLCHTCALCRRSHRRKAVRVNRKIWIAAQRSQQDMKPRAAKKDQTGETKTPGQ